MKTQVTGTYKLYEDNGIVHLIIHGGSCVQYNSAKEINDHIKKHFRNKKHLKLLDIRGSFEIETEAKHFFESPRVKYKMEAQAILVSHNTKQVIIDLFIEMKSKKLPSKMFVNYDEAIKWLNTFKQKKLKN